MKLWAYIFIFLIFANYVSGQTVVSSCVAPQNIINLYKRSADKLAVRRVVYTGNTYKDSVTINKQLSNYYLKALLAVYNATALAARDTIMVAPIIADNYMPHDLNTIYISADSTKNWTKNLRNNLIPCGNSGIDNLISKYYLKKMRYSHTFGTSLYHVISFKTDSNCFINRLCDKFNALYLQGVGMTGPNNENWSDGFNITDSINTNFTELTYSYGWGGCMIPCIYRRYWKFRVYNDCSVEYRGSYGQALPFNPFTGSLEYYSKKFEISISPNPIKDKFKLHFEQGKLELKKLSITNTLGQTVFALNEPNTNQEIDISFLVAGVYYLQAESATERHTFKILKE